ncbi:phenazine biosynthesis protein [Defluviimonas sp. 20V17]|uniref:Phenazine biosynthesis protein PhzF n=1 Tax=Allgaiera indica TaxID=765699 RepID=A0AAN4UPP8_9RHOB|nr:PhzF family phenazine biosynthesis protein [Allgaiera indica]KDB03744.1 phenazine biosynthesis protein [Defluviimonas sp. 20V17]GHD99909.1 phenazine biosynthesis protein PhzF [Allgaiera indica]SDW40857.1 trans-2,3-dihydro-3-hydroxyanthranilate isomerase [Allgaiera indica]
MLEFHTLDVFTATPFAGNPLAVVLGADALSPAQMQVIAREFNLSETIFVQRPRDPAHSARVRIFFPTAEIPFAGHPTVGCAVLLAETAHPEGGDFTTRIALEEEAGLVPVTVTRAGGVTRAEFTAPVIPHAFPGALPEGLLARALDLAPGAIGFGGHRPALWQGGPAFLYVPVVDRAALARARVIEPAYSELQQAVGAPVGLYLYTPGEGVDFQARMLDPVAGIPEDPATGSASAILAAQLQAAGALKPGMQVFDLLQGAEMGRPSNLRLSIESGPEGLCSVRIAGAAVRISSGRITVPAAT